LRQSGLDTTPEGRLDVLELIDTHLRLGETLDAEADLLVRGWPLTVEGLLRNADATRSRYSWHGEPLAAISAEVTSAAWTLDAILAGPRLRTRTRYAQALVSNLTTAGFELLPTFGRSPLQRSTPVVR